MFLNIRSSKKSYQQGSSLIVAVFLIVVFAILSLGITQTISSSTDQNINEILGTRALLAAESGNEIVLQQLFPLNGAAPSCAATQQTYFYTDGLLHCNVVSNCNEQTVSEIDYYQVVSTGICKAFLQGSNINKQQIDSRCLANELCVSRTIEVEAIANE